MTTREEKSAAWERMKTAVEKGVEPPDLPRPIYRIDPNNHLAVSIGYLAYLLKVVSN